MPFSCIATGNPSAGRGAVRFRWRGFRSLKPKSFTNCTRIFLQPEPSPAEAMTQNETGSRLRQCIEMLPEKHRQIIRLRFFEDASLPDMAAVLGCSVGTVKSRLHHALEKLRKMKMNLPGMKEDKQI